MEYVINLLEGHIEVRKEIIKTCDHYKNDKAEFIKYKEKQKIAELRRSIEILRNN